MIQEIMASPAARTLLLIGSAMIVTIGYYYFTAPNESSSSNKNKSEKQKLRGNENKERSILVEEETNGKDVAVDVIIQDRSINITFEKQKTEVDDIQQMTREIIIQEEEKESPEKESDETDASTPDTTESTDLDISLGSSSKDESIEEPTEEEPTKEEPAKEEPTEENTVDMTPTAEEELKETGSVESEETPELSPESEVTEEKDYSLTLKDNDNSTTSTSITTASVTTTIAEEDESASKDTVEDGETWDLISDPKIPENGENEEIGPVTLAAIAAAAAAEKETKTTEENKAPSILYEDKFITITPTELTLNRYHKPKGTPKQISRDTIERVYLGKELNLNYFRKSWWGTITFSSHTIFWAKCEGRETNDDKKNFIVSTKDVKVKDGFTAENPELVASLLDEYIVRKN